MRRPALEGNGNFVVGVSLGPGGGDRMGPGADAAVAIEADVGLGGDVADAVVSGVGLGDQDRGRGVGESGPGQAVEVVVGEGFLAARDPVLPRGQVAQQVELDAERLDAVETVPSVDRHSPVRRHRSTI